MSYLQCTLERIHKPALVKYVVFVKKNSPYSSSQSTVISKFHYSVSRGENQGGTGVEASSKSVLVDEDGDLDVPRREHKIRDKIITLCECMWIGGGVAGGVFVIIIFNY